MKPVASPFFRSILVGSLGVAAAMTFLHVASSPRFRAQTGGESACDNVDNDGTGVVDEGCYACKADERFVVGNRTYCFSFASFGIDLSAADAECRSFGGQLASYTDGEKRADVMEIIAKYVSIAYKQPVYPQALIIKSTCQEMTTAFRQPDADIYFDTGAPPGVMDCSYPILMHSGSQEGKLNDGTGGAGDGAVCEIWSGFCCVTDGQACVPMTLAQCDASGIGFAQDQATCNVLCGVISSSSSSRSSSSVSSISSVSSSSRSSSSVSSISSVSSSSRSSSSVSSISSVSSSSSSRSSSSSSSSRLPSSVSSFTSISSTPQTHTYCNAEKACKSMSGPGTNQCSTDADCTASSSARSSSSSLAPIPQCGDGKDNDGDGKKDFPADPGCFAPDDESEADGPRLPQCSDNVDNDGDSLIDFPDDPGCADLDDATELDRGDMLTACGDKKDNDGDDLIDFPADPGCSGPLDNSEVNAAAQKRPACGNGLLEKPSEECDDGNARSFDGCSEHCLLEVGVCGDGVLQKALGEQCEPPLSDPALPYRCENCRMVFSFSGEDAAAPLASIPSVPFSPSFPSGLSPYAFLPPSQLPGVSYPFGHELRAEWQVSEKPQDLTPESWKLKAHPLPQRTTETGPELLAIMAAGAAGGFAYMRRQRRAVRVI